ncbi:hypothetical protein [Rubrolithibacter danxiaensis]|uniref:hypothetical protein n=1 Tax=Rubrolithibacter danxiaensis TaxID=3390805 RepID=UPI003BF7CFC2
MKTTTYTSLFQRSVVKTIGAAILLAAGLNVNAQNSIPDNIHIGIVYPISTHGNHAAADTNIFSLNLLGGVSSAEKGLTFSGLTNVILNNATGLQFAGISNHVGNRSEGFLFAGVANTYKEGNGMAFAGISNIASGKVEGAQFAGLLNTAADALAAQFAGFTNISHNITGSQFGGFANISHDMTGSQFAGFINVAAKVKGSQFAGFSNIAGGKLTGSQFSGFLNKAGDVAGSQFAGFINIAKNVKGAQLAGFINIADSSDSPVGLLNLIKHGEKSIGISTDDNLTTLVSFRSGGRSLYGILGAGYNFNNTEEVYAIEAGFGAHFFESRSFRLNTELAAVTLESFKTGEYFKGSLRLLPAVRLARYFELFGGPVFNYVNTNTGEGKSLTNHYFRTWTERPEGSFQGLYIGYTGGFHFLF